MPHVPPGKPVTVTSLFNFLDSADVVSYSVCVSLPCLAERDEDLACSPWAFFQSRLHLPLSLAPWLVLVGPCGISPFILILRCSDTTLLLYYHYLCSWRSPLPTNDSPAPSPPAPDVQFRLLIPSPFARLHVFVCMSCHDMTEEHSLPPTPTSSPLDGPSSGGQKLEPRPRSSSLVEFSSIPPTRLHHGFETLPGSDPSCSSLPVFSHPGHRHLSPGYHSNLPTCLPNPYFLWCLYSSQSDYFKHKPPYCSSVQNLQCLLITIKRKTKLSP